MNHVVNSVAFQILQNHNFKKKHALISIKLLFDIAKERFEKTNSFCYKRDMAFYRLIHNRMYLWQ
jgi:hypothetical protein